MDDDHLSPATWLVVGGRPHAPGSAVSPGVELTSTYRAGGETGYARVDNATWRAFEETLGRLEGGSCLAFASGMAAVAAVIALVPAGASVVAPRACYNGVGALLHQHEQEGRLQVRRVDLADTAAVTDAVTGAALLWTESPSNPLLEVADLPALHAAARAAGALAVCDNTFSTPLLQRPLELGADVVVHSATKYLAGHSDVLMGATVTADAGLQERLHRRRTLGGAVPGPMETWLALRGMRTLHLRLERACANAARLAALLDGHPAVARVRYPGTGAVVSVELAGGRAAAQEVERSVRVWTPATSIGGVESLLERRRRHPDEPAAVPEELVRLSVGVEDVDDLWRDLDRALRAAHPGRG